jgi:3-hydroxyacyl-CoA dehydrogenase
MYKISIIGSGTVGGAIGKVFTKYGYHVIFYDLERERLKELASRVIKSLKRWKTRF